MISGVGRRERAGPGQDIAKRSPKYIVSDEHRFVYFVMPKVACSSLKTALLPLFNFREDVSQLERENRTKAIHPLFAESPYELRREAFLRELESGRYDGYFKFAFVRNPWDRLVSCYLQKLAPGAGENKVARWFARRGGSGGSWRKFVRLVCETPDARANPHFRSQHIGLCGENGELLPDFVGRFEDLEEDFARVVRKIGAPHLKLPHLTPSLSRAGRPYRDFYDDETAERVGERFRKDAEIFGYSF